MYLLKQINEPMAFLCSFILHFALQKRWEILEVVPRLKEEFFFLFFLSFKISVNVQGRLNRKQKVYCAQMHSSVLVQDRRPKEHGWLYIMAIRGFCSSDNHYIMWRREYFLPAVSALAFSMWSLQVLSASSRLSTRFPQSFRFMHMWGNLSFSSFNIIQIF